MSLELLRSILDTERGRKKIIELF